MKVAAVILNYNSADLCKKCIALLQQQSDVDLTIIAVDNASAPNDREELKNFCETQNIVFLAAEENRGYNAGNNIGLRYAAQHNFEFTLICNPDMEFPNPDFVATLAQSMANDDSIAAASGDIRTPEGIHQNPRCYGDAPWYRSFDWIKEALSPKQDASGNPTWIENPGESHFCTGLNGCCLLLRTAFLEKIGFFDERIFLYGEEQILAKQVARSGDKMFYCAQTYAIHNHIKKREDKLARRNKFWRHSRLHYIRYYTDYPFYGKWFAISAIITYFMVLNIYHLLKK